VSQYGDFVHITDIVDLTVEDAVLTEAAEVLGEQMGQTMDWIIKDILAACASAYSPTDKKLSDTNVQYVVKLLIGNKAAMISRVVTASSGVGTEPVRPAFFGIMHSDLITDLEDSTDCPSFIPTNKYPAQQPVMDAEWGATKNVRWLYSQQAHDSVTGDPRYFLMIIGKNAYGTTRIDGSSVKNIVKGFGSGGTEDALNQRATSGWKNTFVARILNDNFMHLLKVNAGA